ncbi:hydroxymethylglutaryl-CoA reductase, degradative [Oceanobacillus senegalensis]|uniref:hydroxymethylglutaryl-CoA reductase, degradative n=1 Tax=Oceanobacillus senegalensis TaxID=1936063 RepID=UPI000A305677|nr:hydroxymethylglutaryl-CoA reductase, degradative [Oceanobacillus senegalensis]
MSTRIPGFYNLSPNKRLEHLAKHANLSKEETEIIKGGKGFSVADADRMIENVIGYMPIPLGIAVNFKVNGKDIFVPMATEEPSVVAAASNAAKYTYNTGGFTTSYSGSIMRGQIQLTNVNDPYGALARIYENKEKILAMCNEQDPTLVSLGGGAKDLEVFVIDGLTQKMVVVHLLVDSQDAMGANAINTMAEAVAPVIEEIAHGKAILRILSNLADKRIIRARGVFENPFQDNEEAMENFLSAYELALIDPYRAATHNKGIMNGISAVVLATGNDTRAVEAGAHAYASMTNHYQSLTHWERGENNSLVGTIELPLAVGLIGGATKSHPIATLATKIMQVETAEELAGVIASVGLAQNFAALKALAGEGVQKGHMKLHARNLAIMAGAKENQLNEVVKCVTQKGSYRFDEIKEIVDTMNKME